MEKQKMLAITGANGFLGTSITRAAIARGLTVTGVVRSDEGARVVRDIGVTPFISRNYAEADLIKAMHGATAVIHLIATGGRGPAKQIMDINLNITRRVVQAALKAGVKKIVYLSGLGVVEHGGGSNPANMYFKSKFMAEQEITDSGLKYTIFRPSFIIGPSDYTTSCIVREIADGYVNIPSSKEAILQPIALDDAVSAIVMAASSSNLDNGIYDLVGSEKVSIEMMIGKVFQAIKECNVKISPPVVITVDESRRDECDEVFDFLKYTVEGNPASLVKKSGMQLSQIDAAITAAVKAILKPDEVIPEKRAVMLLSGGLDSITTLYWARHEGYEVIPVSMMYPSRPTREIRAVKEIAKRLGIAITEVPVPFIKEVLELKLDGFPVPSLFGSSDYYVPYRNLIFNAIATFYADIHGARYILSGHIVSDPLPDANEPFFAALEDLVAHLKVGEKAVAPKFLLPMKGKTKADAVRMAKDLGVPLEWTWSCAFDGDTPCGHCKPCRERAEGFKEAGLIDPVIEFRVPKA
nr:7-cyano-7-deazaguanine synthase [Candidatus Sigynarchaeota archaeon]